MLFGLVKVSGSDTSGTVWNLRMYRTLPLTAVRIDEFQFPRGNQFVSEVLAEFLKPVELPAT